MNKNRLDALLSAELSLATNAAQIKLRAERVISLLAFRLAKNMSIYQNHMATQRPFLALLSGADLYTKPFAKYIVMEYRKTHGTGAFYD